MTTCDFCLRGRHHRCRRSECSCTLGHPDARPMRAAQEEAPVVEVERVEEPAPPPPKTEKPKTPPKKKAPAKRAIVRAPDPMPVRPVKPSKYPQRTAGLPYCKKCGMTSGHWKGCPAGTRLRVVDDVG